MGKSTFWSSEREDLAFPDVSLVSQRPSGASDVHSERLKIGRNELRLHEPVSHKPRECLEQLNAAVEALKAAVMGLGDAREALLELQTSTEIPSGVGPHLPGSGGHWCRRPQSRCAVGW